MFKDWSDEKLLQEVEEGFKEYADIKVKDSQDLIEYYKEQIKQKEREINKIEWEMGVAMKDVEEWQEVLDRIKKLLFTPLEPATPIDGEEPTDPEGGEPVDNTEQENPPVDENPEPQLEEGDNGEL